MLSWFLLLSGAAFGQSASGTLLGTVRDSTGAAVPKVEVKATNNTSGVVRTAVANEKGNFRLEQLQKGTYSVEASFPGFRRVVRANVNVYIGEKMTLDFVMLTGSETEAVAITSPITMVETADSAISQLVDERLIVTLPLNGRDLSQLANVLPGGFVAPGVTRDANQFILDGVNNNTTGSMEMATRVNVDSIAEFNVRTGGYSAETGRYGGAQVDIITKSGANAVHGSAQLFTRNDNLDTRNAFDPFPMGKLPEFRRHQYGVAAGGPIIRNKAFFFVAYQGQRQEKFLTSTPTVPLADFWNGNLSAMSAVARDPLTGNPFPGQRIPAARIHSISLKFRPFWPSATKPGLNQNATSSLAQPDRYSHANEKVDLNLNDRHSLQVAHNYFFDRLTDLGIAGSPEVSGFGSDSHVASQGLSVAETWVVTPTVVSQFRAGFARIRKDQFPENATRNRNAEFGIPGTTADTESQAWGLPYVNVSGFARIGDNTNLPQQRRDQSWSIADTVSIVKGSHAFKVGADYLLQQMNLVLMSNGRGAFDFDGSRTGNAFADFLLGLPSVTRRQPPLSALSANPRRTSINAFMQDDWTVSRNFTLNAGLRYEYTGRLREKYGKLATFDPTLNSGQGGIRMLGTNNRWDSAVTAFRQLYPTLAIVRGSDDLYHNDSNNLAPRVGWAWSPLPNTVFRGSYGMFYSMDDLCSCDYYDNPPFNLAQRFTAADGISWDNPWGTVRGTGISISAIDPKLAEPYYQQWTIDVQHEIPGGFLFKAAYVGSKGTKLARIRDINQPMNRRVNSIRPYANFDRINYLENSGLSIYQGLQTRVEKKTAHGQSILISYDFGKLIDNASLSPQDSYNLQLERGLANDDVRHRINASFIVPLPFGANQRFARDVAGLKKGFFGGWQIAGIFRANSGSPITPNLSIARSGTNNAGWDRPNLVGESRLKVRAPQGWWNSAAFTLPAAGEFGTAGRNTLLGPGAVVLDASLLKNVTLYEEKELQVRLEVFNLMNHANYNNPTSRSVNTSNFGVVSGAAASRQIQLGMKFLF